MATEFISNSWLMPTNANAEANRVSNYSLDFDGSSSKITFSAITLASSYTISAWAKRDSASNNEFLLGNDATYGYGAYFNGTTAIYFKQDSGNTTFNNSAITTALARTDWVNWVFVKDSTAGTIAIYVDGTLAQSVTSSLGMTNLTAIGGDGTAATNYIWSGKITEVSIFDYALSAPQVTELYGTGSAIGNPMAITNGRKPVAYYPLGNSAFNSEFLVPNGAEQDYVFDFASQDYINCGKGIGNSIGDNYTGGLTVSGWINPNTTSSDDGVFQFGNFTGYEMALVLNRSKFIFYNNGEKFSVSYTNLNEWTHFALTFLPSGSVFYVNGVLSANWTYTDLDLNNLDFIIGSYYNSGFNLDGKASNISVFNTALPATGTESVESLYNYGTPPNIASYSNLQAWWELDASATFDGSNWSIPDASSNSNTGTSSGMTAANLILSDLVINQSYDPFSLSFDGTDDDMTITNINLGTTHTISFWMKSDGTDRLDMFCNSFGQSRIYGPNVNGSLFYNANGTNQYVIWNGQQGLNDNNWHHMCFVRNGTSVDFYADSVLQTVAATAITATDEYQFTNFMHAPATSRYTKGTISNLSVYTTNITSAQVKTLYNEHKPFDLNNFEVTPTNWWRLGSVNSSYNSTTSEWTVLDEVGNNNGTGSNLGPAQTALSDGVGATGSGLSSGMSSGTNRTGDAPYSDNNAVSYNMSVLAKSTSVPT